MSSGRPFNVASSLFTQFTFFSIFIPGLFTTALLFPLVPRTFYRQFGGLAVAILVFAVAFLSGMVFYVFSDLVEMWLRRTSVVTTPMERLHHKLTLGDDGGDDPADPYVIRFLGSLWWLLTLPGQALAMLLTAGAGHRGSDGEDGAGDEDAGGTDNEDTGAGLEEHLLREFVETEDFDGKLRWEPGAGYRIAPTRAATESADATGTAGEGDTDGGTGDTAEGTGEGDTAGGTGEGADEGIEPGFEDTEHVYRLAVSEAWGNRKELPNTLVNMTFMCRSLTVQSAFFLAAYAALLAVKVLFFDPLWAYRPAYTVVDWSFFYPTVLLALAGSMYGFWRGYDKFGGYFIDYLVIVFRGP